MTQHFFITVLVIYGVHASTRTNMILEFLWIWIFELLDKVMDNPSIILKPLFDCTPCMASIYGTISYFMLDTQHSVIGLLVWVFAICGYNYVLNKILN